MSRRFPYLAAAFVVLTAAVIIWLVSRPRHSPSAATAPPPPPLSLAADAAMLVSASGKWQSDVVKMTVRDGTVRDQILGIEFSAGEGTDQSNAPDARAKLFTSSLSKGIPHVAEASTSFGDGSFRDVRLQESNGVRTITITARWTQTILIRRKHSGFTIASIRFRSVTN